jgi:hypothetical protein
LNMLVYKVLLGLEGPLLKRAHYGPLIG